MKKLIKMRSIIFEDEEVFICLNEETNIYSFLTLKNGKYELVSKDIEEKLNKIYNVSDGKVRGNIDNKDEKNDASKTKFYPYEITSYDMNNRPYDLTIYLSEDLKDYAWFIKSCLKDFSDKYYVNNTFGHFIGPELLNGLHVSLDETKFYDYYDIYDKGLYFKDVDFPKEAFFHELFHYLTASKVSGNDCLGFERFTRIDNIFKNSYTGINEGATDYYAYGEKASSYEELKFFYKKIVDILGEERPKYYYSHSMLEPMIYDLEEQTGLSYREISIIFLSLDILNSSIIYNVNMPITKKEKEKLQKMFNDSFNDFERLHFNYLLKHNPNKIKEITFDNYFDKEYRKVIEQNKNFYNDKMIKSSFENLKESFERKAEREIKRLEKLKQSEIKNEEINKEQTM